MVRVTPDEWVAKYERGIREAAQKYVDHALRYGVPKVRRYAGIHQSIHQAAAYIPICRTDPERLRNVQLSWESTRTASSNYHGRGITGAALALPVAARLPP